MKTLSAIEKRILKSLLADGRKNFTEIAEENDTTKDVVWKRFREMEKKGIIVGATIQYNYQSFGYNGLASILLNVESHKIDQIIGSIRKNQKILVSRFYGSTYNIWVLAILKTLRDIERVKEAIRRQNPINEIKTFLWVDVRNTPENIVTTDGIESPEEDKPQMMENTDANTSIALDETDLKIVEKLNENGRSSFREIGREIGVSTDTVTRRYEKLIKNNYIKVCLQVNPKELGYQSVLIINVLLSNQDKMSSAAETISRIPGVTYVVKTSGDFDLNVAAMVKDCNDIVTIIEKLEMIPNVRKIDTNLRDIPSKWPGPSQYISTF